MPTYEITIYSDGTATIEDVSYAYGEGGGELAIISAIVGYILAFVGMIIMLFSVPVTMMFPAILAMILFLIPAGIALGKGAEIGAVVGIIAKNAYLFFGIFVGMWWILYSLGTVYEPLLIGILVATMYSMYYFPALVVFDSMKRDTPLAIPGAVTTFILSLVIYLFALMNEEAIPELSSYMPIIFSTSVTVIGTVFLLINRFIYLAKEGLPLWKNLIFPAIYLIVATAIALTAFVFVPGYNTAVFEKAIADIEAGNYREAREGLLSIGRSLGADDKYESIKFTELEVGEKISFGEQKADPEDLYARLELSWTVVSVEKGKALLLADSIINSVNAPPLSEWKNANAVRLYLTELYDYLFSEEDKARVAHHTYTVEAGNTAFGVTDPLFILSQEELEALNMPELVFSESDTGYNDKVVLNYLMSHDEYEYKYTYYVRSTTDEGEWIIADCESDIFTNRGSLNTLVGIRPAVYITTDSSN